MYIGITPTILLWVCSKSCKEGQSHSAPICHVGILFFNQTNGDLPLQTAVWTLALHFPEVVHLTSSLTPDKMNPWRQLSWQIVPGLAGCLPQFGGDTMTPLGFWKVEQWRSIVGKWENVTCVPTHYKCHRVSLPKKNTDDACQASVFQYHNSRHLIVNEMNLCSTVNFILPYWRD